jgi:hypothetical protein
MIKMEIKYVIQQDQEHPTCGPKWIQNFRKFWFFGHFPLSFWQIAAQITRKKLNCGPDTNLGWTPLNKTDDNAAKNLQK